MSLSHGPHRPRGFVENKSPTPIRQDCQKAVEAIFLCFLRVQSGSISAFFFCFYCSIGRGLQAFPNYRVVPGLASGFFCQRTLPLPAKGAYFFLSHFIRRCQVSFGAEASKHLSSSSAEFTDGLNVARHPLMPRPSERTA